MPSRCSLWTEQHYKLNINTQLLHDVNINGSSQHLYRHLLPALLMFITLHAVATLELAIKKNMSYKICMWQPLWVYNACGNISIRIYVSPLHMDFVCWHITGMYVYICVCFVTMSCSFERTISSGEMSAVRISFYTHCLWPTSHDRFLVPPATVIGCFLTNSI